MPMRHIMKTDRLEICVGKIMGSRFKNIQFPWLAQPFVRVLRCSSTGLGNINENNKRSTQ